MTVKIKKQMDIDKPLPKLFPIDKDNDKTWPWIDCLISGDPPRAKVKWIKNPLFKYGHLIPGY